jgi:hypothetical protein
MTKSENEAIKNHAEFTLLRFSQMKLEAEAAEEARQNRSKKQKKD